MNQIDGSEGAIFYAAGVFHYFTEEQVRKMVVAMSERFPGAWLVFDAVGKFGRDVLMKKTLQKMGMNNISALFCVRNEDDLDHWSDSIRLVSRKSFMQGYYKLDDPNIRPVHRFLAMLCDHAAKMYIYKLELRGSKK